MPIGRKTRLIVTNMASGNGRKEIPGSLLRFSGEFS